MNKKENKEISYIEKVNAEAIAISSNKFCADYSIRGTAKCRFCKKHIPKGELRMGTYTSFKGRTITNYYHVKCNFNKMRKARVESNVIKDSHEIDGFNNLAEADQQTIRKHILEEKCIRTAPLVKSYTKKTAPIQDLPNVRRKKLKMVKTASMEVLFTNADQFTHSKKDELQERIISLKPKIIAVSEVKPKNGKDTT